MLVTRARPSISGEARTAGSNARRSSVEKSLVMRVKLAPIAALDTRSPKAARPREDLFAEWQEVGRQHHWTTKEASFLLDAPFHPRAREQEMAEAGMAAVVTLTQGKAHCSVREITQAIAEEGQGRGLGAGEIFSIREALLRSPEFVKLSDHKGEEHWTTREVLRIEQALLSHCQTLHEREVPNAFAAAAVQDSLLRHPDLSEEQRSALEHVTEASFGIRLVSGMAGTGKSTLFRAAREVWATQGVDVLGAALSGKAARGLQESTGIKSQTLHRTLLDIEGGKTRLGPNSVFVIDEAAMVGTRQLARVAAECVKSGATLVLAGDARQLQAIDLGGAFAEVSRRFGAATLTEIKRQREEWAREAVTEFARGAAESALSAYAQRGLVFEAGEGGKSMAMEALMRDWSRELPGPKDRDIAILAGSNAQVSILNRMAQEARGRAGLLGEAGLVVGKEHVHEGDRVLLTRNSMAIGVMNGDRGTVREINGGTLVVDLDMGGFAQVDTRSYAHERLGYAMTVHKAQGMTLEKAFLLIAGGMVDREMAYVEASRSRGATRWYVADELDVVTPAMARSREKTMAVALTAEGLELAPER